MNITRRWKRLLAVGCSHGYLADKKALDAVLDFKSSWKPNYTVHLGDFLDTTALRGGAAGTPDESEPIDPDMNSGLAFLSALRPNLILCGNHEARIWHLARHHNAIVAECAERLKRDIEHHAAKLKADLVEYRYKAWRDVSNIRFMHGEIYNESACRDTAEGWAPQGGKVVFAHTHQAGFAKGRRHDNPSAYCVGTLASVPNMDYAAHRRKTLAWSAGFVWGEYCETESILWLSENGQGTTWRLPI